MAIKQRRTSIIKVVTDVTSNQQDGTVHAYDYFNTDDNRWVYNICFHVGHGFGTIQIKEQKRLPIAQAIKKAREQFNRTKFSYDNFYGGV